MAYSAQSSISQQFKAVTDYYGGQRHTFSNNRFLQTGDSGGTTEYSTIGPERNEIFTTYTYGQGTHHIRFLAYVSPDILLVHQSKVAGFYRAVSSGRTLDPIGRDVKDQLLRGSSIRIGNNTSSTTFTAATTTASASTTSAATTSGTY